MPSSRLRRLCPRLCCRAGRRRAAGSPGRLRPAAGAGVRRRGDPGLVLVRTAPAAEKARRWPVGRIPPRDVLVDTDELTVRSSVYGPGERGATAARPSPPADGVPRPRGRAHVHLARRPAASSRRGPRGHPSRVSCTRFENDGDGERALLQPPHAGEWLRRFPARAQSRLRPARASGRRRCRPVVLVAVTLSGYVAGMAVSREPNIDRMPAVMASSSAPAWSRPPVPRFR